MRNIGSAWALGAALAASACGIEPAPPGHGRTEAPLIGGATTEDDPAVVALTRGSNVFCSGTLISPSVVLTAAHCIDMAGSDPGVAIYFGSDTRGEGTRIAVKRKQQHREWTGSLAGGHDIGLILLEFPYTDPLVAMPINADSPADQHVGAEYRHVGFGVYDRETQASDGKKRQGVTTITGTPADVIVSGDESLSVCFGDSGGPGLLTIDGVEVVAGVHSYTTGGDCFPPNGDTRVDLYAADFIVPWVQQNDPTCRRDLTCAPIGCIDDPDCTPCGPDGTCTADCELPDPDCATSALGEICQKDTQCADDGAQCVFWQGDLDYHFCTVSCTPGAGGCPDGMRCQNVPPFGDVCYFDDEPEGVLGDDCDVATDCGTYQCVDGTCTRACDLSTGLTCPARFSCESRDDGGSFHCFPPPDEGGCQSGGPGGAAGALGVLAALALAWRRRRA